MPGSNLQRAFASSQAGVDVACTKKGSSFRGDQANRQHVSLRLMDLVELAEANEAGKPHWAGAEVSASFDFVGWYRVAQVVLGPTAY